jgi:hypothetical protein
MTYIGSVFGLECPNNLGVTMARGGATRWAAVGTLTATISGGNSSTFFIGTATNQVQLKVKAHSAQTNAMLQTLSTADVVTCAILANGQISITPLAGTGTQPAILATTPPAHTALTASTEYTDVNLNLARTVQFATGALTTQRAMRVQAPTYGFVGSSTITTASTVAISGAPVAGTNATITNSYALNIESGVTRLNGGQVVKRTATAVSVAAGVDDYIIGVTSTAAARTITLPTAVNVTGRVYIVKDESGGAATNNITVDCTGGQTINGAATNVINTNYGSVTVYSDGANWFTI